MRCIRLLLFAVLLLSFPLVAQSEWSTDPAEGNPVCTATGEQFHSTMLPDGEGGAFIVWTDDRAGYRIYAQRLDADGEPLWASNGIRVCTYESTQNFPSLATDMAGGFFVVWQDWAGDDSNIYGQRISPSGSLLWSSGGMSVCTFANSQVSVDATSDGQGGLLAAWSDYRNDTGDIYAQRINADGAALWTIGGVAVCTETGTQSSPAVLSDQNGGVTIAWEDERDSSDAIYARRVNYLGTPLWTEGGNLVATGTTSTFRARIVADDTQGYLISFVDQDPSSFRYRVKVQRMSAAGQTEWDDEGVAAGADDMEGILSYQACSDGVGGVFLAWLLDSGTDLDLRAQRVDGNGTRIWGVSGRTVCNAEEDQHPRFLVPDDGGGVLIGWQDYRTGNPSLYTHRLDAYGNEMWSDGGNVVHLGSSVGSPAACSDGQGGLITAWTALSGETSDIYAQRVDETGYLGAPAPHLDAVVDMPNDQGGVVNLHWTAGYVDALPWYAVSNYSTWMRQPGAKSATAIDDLTRLGELLGSAPEALSALAASGWTFIEQVPATMSAEYGSLAPTYGDSTLTEPNATEYLVIGHGADPWILWESQPLAGSSVDNLAPGAPQGLAGEWTSFTEVGLSWNPVSDADLALYRVYRGGEPGFDPEDGELLGTTTGATFLDTAFAGSWYYRVAAVDVHDNEGPVSDELCMTSASTVGDAVPNVFALHANFPNPFNPSTNICFELPEAVRVDLAVYSVDGARVATLRSGVLSAGRHDVTWRGIDDAGRAQPSGVYFFRLNAGEFTQTRTMVLLR